MNSKDFYSYWSYIESRAFLPEPNDKGIKNWLRCFGRFVNQLFEKGDTYPAIKGKNIEFIYKLDLTHFGVTCESRVKTGLSKFSFTINRNGSAIQFAYDNDFTCEFDYLEDHVKERSKEFDEAKLRKVLEYKIDHPAIHCHIRGKISSAAGDNEIDFPHDIRIGAAGKNPFLFLYQLAYQFLALFGAEAGKKKRERELNRLVDVIFENREKDKISPGILLGL